MRATVLLVLLVVACGPPVSTRRCDGNVVEEFGTDGDDHSHEWRVKQRCGPTEMCVETTLDYKTSPDLDWAFCAQTPLPDPICAPPTGRRCVDERTMITCLDGMRISNDETQLSRCSELHPYCVEPEPGLAFCVADPTPSSLCSGAPIRTFEICALEQAACRDAQGQSFCADERTGVRCVGGIVVELHQCWPPTQTTTGTTCHATDYFSSSMCR